MSENINTEASQKFPMMPIAPLGVIAMRGCEEMGKAVNEYLTKWQVDNSTDEKLHSFYGSEANGFLIRANCPRFGTGEGKGMLLDSVRGYDLYIICDVGAYQCTYKLYGKEVPMTPDEHYADLKRIIAAVSGKAKRINVIMPMLYEGRQHRRTARESMDCALMLQELVSMGVANIITFDAHDPRVQNAIPLNGFESIMPTYQMLKAMCAAYDDLKIDKEHMMVVSPDEGAIGRNIYYSSAMGVDLGMFYKRRDYTRVVNGRNPIVAHEYMGVDVAGKDIFVADDIIASGDSMLDLAYNLKRRGAKRVFAGATFAFFTSGLEAFNKAYEEGVIDRVFATNLTYATPEVLQAPWFTQADMSKYMAFVIATINHDQSISYLLDPWKRIERLLTNYREDHK
ncbi:MAG: ribose-phosphate pyrophosphokinase [Christensenellales bacterium]|nr:ribose-phosphate pyrophosphokinase [Christensenellales bacterium]